MVLLIFTPTTLLEIENSNSSTFFEIVTAKLCTKIKESLENFCKEKKECFYSKTEIRMSSSGSPISGNEISDISYTLGATGEGVTSRRLSSIRFDYRENYASSSSSTI